MKLDDESYKLIRKSYDSLMSNVNLTLEEFIVYSINGEVIEIPYGTGERSKFIDVMISYFEKTEEFEKCKELLKLRALVVNNGN